MSTRNPSTPASQVANATSETVRFAGCSRASSCSTRRAVRVRLGRGRGPVNGRMARARAFMSITGNGGADDARVASILTTSVSTRNGIEPAFKRSRRPGSGSWGRKRKGVGSSRLRFSLAVYHPETIALSARSQGGNKTGSSRIPFTSRVPRAVQERSPSHLPHRTDSFSEVAMRLTVVAALLGISLPPHDAVLAADKPAKETTAPRTDALGDPLPEGAVARLGTARLCHLGATFLTFASDGSRLATFSNGGMIRIWDVATGKLLREWVATRSARYVPNCSAMAFSPDGRQIALGGSADEPVVRVWDAATGKVLAEWAHAGFVDLPVLAYSADGTRLAFAHGTSVSVGDTKSGKVLQRWKGEFQYPRHVAFSADGKSLAVTGRGREGRDGFRVQVWDPDTGTPKHNHVIDNTSPFVRLSPDGSALAVPDWAEGLVRLLDAATGKLLVTARGANRPMEVAFAADGKTFTASSDDGKIRIWETTAGKLLHRFGEVAEGIDRIALSADGKTVAATNEWTGDIRLWDVAAGKELHTLDGHRKGPVSVAFAADGRSVLVADRDLRHSSPPQPSQGWSLRRWDARNAVETHTWQYRPDSEVRYTAFSPDAARRAVAHNNGRLRLYDTASGKETAAWDLPTKTVTIIRGKDPPEKHQSLWDTDLAFSPDSTTLATASIGSVTLWECATGKQVREIPRPGQELMRCRFHPDGQSLLITDVLKGGAVTRADVRTGEVVQTLAREKDWMRAVAVSPTGRSAVDLADRRVRIHEAISGKVRWWTELGTFTRAVAYSPDGRRPAGGGQDGGTRLVATVTGRPIGRLQGNNGDVASLSFSPDGRWLATGGWNVVLVWDVPALLQKNQLDPPAWTERNLEKYWETLGDENAAIASAALASLIRGGKPAVALLRKWLAEPPAFAAERIDRWMADLESNRFAVREKATQELEKAGGLAEPALKKALAAKPSAEGAERIKKLLAKIDGIPSAVLRVERGLEALELIGDRAGREALRELAIEAGDPHVRQEAAAAARRLERRP